MMLSLSHLTGSLIDSFLRVLANAHVQWHRLLIAKTNYQAPPVSSNYLTGNVDYVQHLYQKQRIESKLIKYELLTLRVWRVKTGYLLMDLMLQVVVSAVLLLVMASLI